MKKGAERLPFLCLNFVPDTGPGTGDYTGAV